MDSASVWEPGVRLVPLVNAQSTLIPQSFIANAAQTVYNIGAFQYVTNVGSLLVFVQGVLQEYGVDYTETSSTSFTLTEAPEEGDLVTCMGFVGTTPIAGGGGSSYTLPIASSTVLGGVKIGSGIAVAGDGTISVTGVAGGTVTHTVSALTANAVILGNAGGDVKVLASLGTSGQVLTSGGAGTPPIWTTPTSGGTGTVTAVSGALTQYALMIGNAGVDSAVLGSLGTVGQILTSAGPGTPPTWVTPSSGGSVTSTSVVTANGFAGTVANPTTTPAITLTTSITGLLKGNGTAILQATAATDFVAPSAYASANGLTMSTLKVLGRTSASTGAAEELSITGTGNVVFSLSPTFSGVPVAPTASGGTSTTQLATTAFVVNGTNFTQLGTGAIARKVNDKLKEVVSVKDFGALGDDSTNDAAAIQAAINYVQSLTYGGAVFFPPGTYRIGSTLTTVNTVPIRLFGTREGSRIRRTTTGDILQLSPTAVGFGHGLVDIRDLFFMAPVAGTSNGIVAAYSEVSISSCRFQTQVTAISLHESYAVYIQDCVFESCASYAVYNYEGANNFIFQRNKLYNCGTTNLLAAVNCTNNNPALNGGNNIRITDNDFEGNYIDVILRNTSSVSIRGNYMESEILAQVVFLTGNYQVDVSYNFFGQLAGGVGSGLVLSNCIGGSCKGNTIYNNNVTTGSGLVDFDVGHNYVLGSGSMAIQNWTAATLVNSWANQVNYNPAGYRKDSNGMVHLRGNMTSGAAFTVCFTLPAGYRPANYATYCSSGVNGLTYTEIRPNGDVYIEAAPSGYTGLNGIQFEAEA